MKEEMLIITELVVQVNSIMNLLVKKGIATESEISEEVLAVSKKVSEKINELVKKNESANEN